MVNTKALVGVTVVVALLGFTFAEVEDHIDCKKLLMIIAKKQLKVFGECSRDMRAEITDPKEYQQKIQCVVKCSMKREKMIDDNYQVTNASIQAFLDNNVPKSFHEIGHVLMDNCLAKYDGKFDLEDPLCITYGEFVKCMQNTIADFC